MSTEPSVGKLTSVVMLLRREAEPGVRRRRRSMVAHTHAHRSTRYCYLYKHRQT